MGLFLYLFPIYRESAKKTCIIFGFVYTRPHTDMVNKNTLKQRKS